MPQRLTVTHPAPRATFPNLGVSLAVLQSVRDDPRMQEPMVRLARPDLADADLDAMGCAELRALAKDLRVFSELPGGEEFPLYERDDGALVQRNAGGAVLPIRAYTHILCDR